ncbi:MULTISPECIES: transcription elongation factor GreAB [unclassified Bacillus (in: firmicutes)]|uniref:transcription elongation factor GreAB n=1 Tax=unclassified Bacillus (in: firmicutes) TaxID=185979 RepID=UPI000BF067D5|nr:MULTISPECIES: transcription elongation factor GreAB [unclassified Bacillus (in: firmicutes)]PEJ53336.1 transcription elongation factor GreAB [Bacillus sp. AFS002410]PEL13037.1 transcription elongation factor GreAB [Bacillus sp. AFS017336]
MKKFFSVLLLILVMLTGCNSDTVYSSGYDGKKLIIGVIGNFPKVSEGNVKFKKISFKKIEENKKLSSEFDAVFIMKKHLSEASDSKYANIYKHSDIPFFFIGSKKSYIAFVDEQFTYEDAPNLRNPPYSIGYPFGKGKNQYCANDIDKVNKNTIDDAYSRIFTSIDSGKCFND